MIKTNILVLSPHLDDAVLSCGDHVLAWTKQGHKVFIITVFTDFGSNPISIGASDYLNKSGFDNTQDFKKERISEDMKAMKKLNVQYKYLNFTDGVFRKYAKKQIYSYTNLFHGKISRKDRLVENEIGNELSKFRNFDKIVIPLGVGKHVDHLLVRRVAEKTFLGKKIMYYVDQPYGQKLENWDVSKFLKLLLSKRSVHKTTNRKKEILGQYHSQIKLLFPNDISNFSEIILE